MAKDSDAWHKVLSSISGPEQGALSKLSSSHRTEKGALLFKLWSGLVLCVLKTQAAPCSTQDSQVCLGLSARTVLQVSLSLALPPQFELRIPSSSPFVELDLPSPFLLHLKPSNDEVSRKMSIFLLTTVQAAINEVCCFHKTQVK